MSALPTVSCKLTCASSAGGRLVGEAEATGCRQTASQIIIRTSNVTITSGKARFGSEHRYWKPGHGRGRFTKDYYFTHGLTYGGWRIVAGSVKEES